jgi:nicotinamidase-related amidase
MDEHTEPHFSHVALLTIDVQRDVLDGGALAVPGSSTVVPRIAALARQFRLAGRPLVHLVRLYRPDGTDVDRVRRAMVERGGPVLAPGTEGCQLVEEVVPGVTLDGDLLLRGDRQVVSDSEWILFKPRWGAFYRTSLAEDLTSLGVTTVVVAGFNFPNCPRTSLYEASERDFRVVAAGDAISGFTESGAAELAGIGAAVLSTAEIVEGLQIEA